MLSKLSGVAALGGNTESGAEDFAVSGGKIEPAFMFFKETIIELVYFIFLDLHTQSFKVNKILLSMERSPVNYPDCFP
jgi:hypothetical protein